MTAEALIAQAESLGLRLIPAGTNLRVRAEAGAIDPAFLAELRAHKPAILDALAASDSQRQPHGQSTTPDPLCPCLTVWRLPGTPGRFFITGRDHDVGMEVPGAVLIARGDPTSCREEHHT